MKPLTGPWTDLFMTCPSTDFVDFPPDRSWPQPLQQLQTLHITTTFVHLHNDIVRTARYSFLTSARGLQYFDALPQLVPIVRPAARAASRPLTPKNPHFTIGASATLALLIDNLYACTTDCQDCKGSL